MILPRLIRSWNSENAVDGRNPTLADRSCIPLISIFYIPGGDRGIPSHQQYLKKYILEQSCFGCQTTMTFHQQTIQLLGPFNVDHFCWNLVDLVVSMRSSHQEIGTTNPWLIREDEGWFKYISEVFGLVMNKKIWGFHDNGGILFGFGDLNSLHCPLSFGVMAAGKNKKTPRSMMEIGWSVELWRPELQFNGFHESFA